MQKQRNYIFALIDTNADPTTVDYPIPSNDDAVRSIKLLVSVIADAIIEAKGGVLDVAFQEDEAEEDITMEDVMVNVEQQAAEYERKKRQRYEERRQQQKERRPYNGERRVFSKKDQPKTEEVAVEETVEAVEPVVEEVAEKEAE